MYVLDTNSLIYFFKGLGRVADHILQVSPSEVGIPAIVLFELETGIAKSSSPQKRRLQLESLLDVVYVLAFGPEEARVSAWIRADLGRRGTPIGPLDTLIAGTALRHRGILVTRNTREFGRVPGIVVEDWYSDGP